MSHLNEVYLGGVSVPELMEKHNIPLVDPMTFLPADYNEIEESKVVIHYLGYYV